MFKKIISILTLSSMLIFPITACSQKASAPTAGSSAQTASKQAEGPKESDKKIIMKIAHISSTESPRHKSLLKFKEMVEERTKKAIEVQIYPSSQLGSEKDAVEAVKMGTIQATRAGMYDMVDNNLLLFSMPFMFQNMDQLVRTVKSPTTEKLLEGSKKNNIIVLALGDYGGFRNITNNVRPIKRPEDMKGLKMRTNGVLTVTKSLEAFGASAVSVPLSDLYLALKTKVVDGQENPLITINETKFYEVQKYVTLLDYLSTPDPFYVNYKWYSTLSPELQDILKKASVEMMDIQNALVKEQYDAAYQVVKNNTEMYVPTAEDFAAFKAKAKPVYDYFISQGTFSQQTFDDFAKSIK